MRTNIGPPTSSIGTSCKWMNPNPAETALGIAAGASTNDDRTTADAGRGSA